MKMISNLNLETCMEHKIRFKNDFNQHINFIMQATKD